MTLKQVIKHLSANTGGTNDTFIDAGPIHGNIARRLHAAIRKGNWSAVDGVAEDCEEIARITREHEERERRRFAKDLVPRRPK